MKFCAFTICWVAHVSGCGGSASTGAPAKNVASENPQTSVPDPKPLRAVDCPTRIVNQIHFEFEKATIRLESAAILDIVAETMSKAPDVKVAVEGHADDKERNGVSLSQDRAIAVVELLGSRNISRKRLTAVGYGSSRPILPNDADVNRALNRRAQFIVIDCGQAQ